MKDYIGNTSGASLPKAFTVNTHGKIDVSTLDISKEIGKFVNYIPNGTTYTAINTGGAENEEFSADPNLKWRIWNITDEYLYLISDKPTTQTLNVTGREPARLYVDSNLNNICMQNYGNSEYNNMIARSLSHSDVTEVCKTKFLTGQEPATRTYEASNADSDWVNQNYYDVIFCEKSSSSPLLKSYWLTGSLEEIKQVNGHIVRWLRRAIITYGQASTLQLGAVNDGDYTNGYDPTTKTLSAAVRPLLIFRNDSFILSHSEEDGVYNIVPK